MFQIAGDKYISFECSWTAVIMLNNEFCRKAFPLSIFEWLYLSTAYYCMIRDINWLYLSVSICISWRIDFLHVIDRETFGLTNFVDWKKSVLIERSCLLHVYIPIALVQCGSPLSTLSTHLHDIFITKRESERGNKTKTHDSRLKGGIFTMNSHKK